LPGVRIPRQLTNPQPTQPDSEAKTPSVAKTRRGIFEFIYSEKSRRTG
jgi:hypothetical protein